MRTPPTLYRVPGTRYSTGTKRSQGTANMCKSPENKRRATPGTPNANPQSPMPTRMRRS